MDIDGTQFASLAGLAGGIVLGLAARLGRFCMMATVEDAVYGSDSDGVRVLSLGAAVAIAATALLVVAGGFDPQATVYLREGWSPAATVIGGLMFGYGMAQVGTCGYGALSRVGGGDLRALVMVAVIGIAGFAAAYGPLAPLTALLRAPVLTTAPLPTLPEMAGGALGLSPAVIALALAGALATAALARRRPPARRMAWAAAVGLAIAGAWAATTAAGRVGFDAVAVQGFSFVAPLGQTLSAGMTGGLGTPPGFGVASVLGVIAGAAIAARIRDDVRWEACDDARELGRQMMGAAMMGVGGVLAVGCTVGQGLSALSVLAVSAPVTVAAIAAGARIGLYQLVERPAA
ncbi:MAG: YeeE/YedE thiosulfate transporter family protein [Pseudomonadota bacterium]